MSMLLLKNGLVVDPSQGISEKMDILIQGDKIAKVAKNIEASQEMKTIDLTGKVITPGFIDLHVHIREPGFEHKETILTGSMAAVRGGFTGIACMPNTNPIIDNEGNLELIKARANRYNLTNIYPIAAVTKGQKGQEITEYGILKEAGAIALSDDGLNIESAQVMRKALDYAKIFDLLIISHCEDQSLAGSGVMHEGFMSTKLGLAGIPALAEEMIIDRDIRLAELTKGKIHIAHVSTREGVEIIRRAKAKGIKVTAEAAPHHFVLTHEAVASYDTNTKVYPPLREKEDVAAIIKGLADGTLDAIATDHAPHAREEKEVEYELAPPGISGLETALPLAWQYLYLPGHLSLLELVACLSTKPAQILGIDRGTLQEGKVADITVIDPQKTEKVDPQSFYSMGRNTTFKGWELQGWPVMTIKDGQIKMENGRIVE